MTAISRSVGSAPTGSAPRGITWWAGIGRVFEYRLLDYRRTYRSSIFNSFVGPALFLAAMGVGLGTYVNDSAALGGVSYLAFLAPGLLAATAMQTAAFESTFPIMGGLEWNRVYHAMFATPIRPSDIALGNIAWIGFRVLLVSSVFVLVTALFGAAASPMIVLAIPVGVLTGLAFAAPITAFSATQRNVNTFNAVFRFGITPLFLFSGTFFPGRSAADGPAGSRVADAAVPRRCPEPRAVARIRGRGAAADARPRRDPAGVRRGRGVRGRAHVRAEAGARMTALRLTPPILFGGRRAGLLIERNLYVYRRTWMVIFSGFFEPLFYLLGIGFGLGALIGDVPGPGGQEISYQLFVAPALLASASMNGAIMESTFNVFFKLNYQKTYDAILSTPMSVGDVALGEICWALIRGGLYAIGFLVVMIPFGLWVSPWLILAFPAALLVGFAFAAVGMAATSFMRTWQDFDLIQLVILPLFLFSATFYPLETYPEALQWVVRITPLYQGVDLIRSLAVGYITPVLLVHVAYLTVMGLIGLAITNRRLGKLLLK